MKTQCRKCGCYIITADDDWSVGYGLRLHRAKNHPDQMDTNPSRIDGAHEPHFDDEDALLLADREAKWIDRQGPRVGDFVRMPNGKLLRLTHDWGPDIQTTADNGDASFYLTREGYGSYSGGLDHAIPKSKLVDTACPKAGWFWFFHHDHSAAHNGVQVQIFCRTFEYLP